MRKKIDLRQCDQCHKIVEQTGQTTGPGPFTGWITISRQAGTESGGGVWDLCSTSCAMEFLGHLDGPVYKAPLPDPDCIAIIPPAGTTPPVYADIEPVKDLPEKKAPKDTKTKPVSTGNKKARGLKDVLENTERRLRYCKKGRDVYEWQHEGKWYTASELADLAGISLSTMRVRLTRLNATEAIKVQPAVTEKQLKKEPIVKKKTVKGHATTKEIVILARQRDKKCHQKHKPCANYERCWLQDDQLDRKDVICPGPDFTDEL